MKSTFFIYMVNVKHRDIMMRLSLQNVLGPLCYEGVSQQESGGKIAFFVGIKNLFKRM